MDGEQPASSAVASAVDEARAGHGMGRLHGCQKSPVLVLLTLPSCLQGQGVDAKIASGGGRMGVTMDRCERAQGTREMSRSVA